MEKLVTSHLNQISQEGLYLGIKFVKRQMPEQRRNSSEEEIPQVLWVTQHPQLLTKGSSLGFPPMTSYGMNIRECESGKFKEKAPSVRWKSLPSISALLLEGRGSCPLLRDDFKRHPFHWSLDDTVCKTDTIPDPRKRTAHYSIQWIQ